MMASILVRAIAPESSANFTEKLAKYFDSETLDKLTAFMGDQIRAWKRECESGQSHPAFIKN